MQYIKFTYVTDPQTQGPVYPAVQGLEFVWARESQYPTNTPEFFGTADDDADLSVEGVLGVYSQADWELMRDDEMRAREAKNSANLRITKLAFRNRFTQTEKVTIELAAADDSSAPMQQRQMSAAVRAYLADVQAATFIDLARQDLQDGVHALESNGLISSGRAESILSNEITHEERYYQ